MKTQTPGPKTRIKHACATVLFFWILLPLHAEPSHMNFDPSDVVASDTRTRLNAVTILQAERASLIDELLKIIDDPKYDRDEWIDPNSPRNIAIRCLGKLRAREAAGKLIGHLTPHKGQVTGLGDEIAPSPAFEALVEIGDPAIPLLFDEIAVTTNEECRILCAKIIVHIIGSKAGKAILLERIEREKMPQKLGNLRISLAQFER